VCVCVCMYVYMYVCMYVLQCAKDEISFTLIYKLSIINCQNMKYNKIYEYIIFSKFIECDINGTVVV
jgi:hypothetical protein